MAGAGSSQSTAVADLSSSIALPPEAPLSASPITDATIDASVPAPVGTTDAESRARIEAPPADTA